MPAASTKFSKGVMIAQAKMAGAGVFGDTLFVDSTSGDDGANGESKIHPLKSLTRAFAICQAGDTIELEPGGTETVTTSLACNKANVKVICRVTSPQQGYELTGAGSLNLLTVSAADVHLEGLRFTRTAAAGGANAGVLTTAAADRLVVKNCSFDYTALTSSWTNFGIELTDAVQDFVIRDCEFRDCHRGIVQVIATGITQVGGLIEDCHFWVGRATAFGYHNDPTSTGVSGGAVLRRCHFHEALASTGAAATDVWDGTNGTDAASGPMLIGALADRIAVVGCSAYTASSDTFENLSRVDAGGLVDFQGNSTGSSGGAGATAAALSTHDGVLVAGLAAGVTARLQDPRSISAVVTLDSGTQADVFTVANGPIEVIGLFIEVTTAVSANACNTSWESDPTVGAGQAPMCAVLDIASFAVGDNLYITGLGSAAMVRAANGTIVGNRCKEPSVVFPGGIDLVQANSDPTTGDGVAWLIYRPLSNTAAVS